MAGSWNRVNHFIIEADQMTHPIHWNPMEDKWKAWVNKNQVYNGTSHFDPKTLDAMRMMPEKYAIEKFKSRVLRGLADELRANTKWLRGAPISLTLFQHVYVDGLEDITQAEMMPLTLTL